MSAPLTSRRFLQSGIRHSHVRLHARSISSTPSARAEKDGVHESNNDHNDPRDGLAYTAGGMRHKTDNEEQREKAVRGTYEVKRFDEPGKCSTNADILHYQQDVTPAAQHAKANKNAQGVDVNKIQTGPRPTSANGKKQGNLVAQIL